MSLDRFYTAQKEIYGSATASPSSLTFIPHIQYSKKSCAHSISLSMIIERWNCLERTEHDFQLWDNTNYRNINRAAIRVSSILGVFEPGSSTATHIVALLCDSCPRALRNHNLRTISRRYRSCKKTLCQAPAKIPTDESVSCPCLTWRTSERPNQLRIHTAGISVNH